MIRLLLHSNRNIYVMEERKQVDLLFDRSFLLFSRLLQLLNKFIQTDALGNELVEFFKIVLVGCILSVLTAL